MTRYANVQEQDRACAAILVDKLRGYVKCEGRRWYVWDEDLLEWKRATVAYGVSRHIVREVRDLIVDAVRENNFEDARGWCRYLYHGDIGIRLTPHMSRIYRENQALLRQLGVGLAEWVGWGCTPPPLRRPQRLKRHTPLGLIFNYPLYAPHFPETLGIEAGRLLHSGRKRRARFFPRNSNEKSKFYSKLVRLFKLRAR